MGNDRSSVHREDFEVPSSLVNTRGLALPGEAGEFRRNWKRFGPLSSHLKRVIRSSKSCFNFASRPPTLGLPGLPACGRKNARPQGEPRKGEERQVEGGSTSSQGPPIKPSTSNFGDSRRRSPQAGLRVHYRLAHPCLFSDGYWMRTENLAIQEVLQ